MEHTVTLYLSCGHTVVKEADAVIVMRPEDGFFHCGREVRIEQMTPHFNDYETYEPNPYDGTYSED
jgi:hypothetical protein